jgi:hypothetical protein
MQKSQVLFKGVKIPSENAVAKCKTYSGNWYSLSGTSIIGRS